MQNPFDSPRSSLSSIDQFSFIDVSVAKCDERASGDGSDKILQNSFSNSSISFDKVNNRHFRSSPHSAPLKSISKEYITKAGRFKVKDITEDYEPAPRSRIPLSAGSNVDTLSIDPIQSLDAVKESIIAIVAERDYLASENARLRQENEQLRRQRG